MSVTTRAALAVALFVCLGIAYPKAGSAMLSALGRFLSGQPMTQGRKTNGTFLHPASKVLDPSGHATKWAKLPGWKRAGYRIEGTIGAIFLLWLKAYHPVILRVTVGMILAGGISAVAYFGRKQWNTRQHMSNIIRPIHNVLAPIADVSASTSPHHWISVPEDYQTNPSARIRISLPGGFAATAAERKEIPPIVAAKLGGEWDHKWNMTGKEPSLILMPSPEPPSMVTFDMVKDILLSAPEHAPILGTGTHDKPISANFNTDSPHICFSMGSGGGKSTAVRGVVVQMIRNGARAEFVDVPKHGTSHMWAKGIPGVSVWRTAETAHNALVRLGLEMQGRYEEIYSDPAAEDRFSRVAIVMEELNATMHMLKTYWQSVRTKEDPKESPAIQAFSDILCAGRQCRFTVITVAQSLTVRALGGPEMRENFAYRVLGRYTLNAWKMLAPEVWPAPRSSRHLGRVQVVTAGEASACQVTYWTDQEARLWALAGDKAREPVTAVLTVEETEEEEVTEPVKTYTLGQACAVGIIPLSYDAAKKARQRDNEFPEGTKYTADALQAWYANRESTSRKADA